MLNMREFSYFSVNESKKGSLRTQTYFQLIFGGEKQQPVILLRSQAKNRRKQTKIFFKEMLACVAGVNEKGEGERERRRKMGD